MNVLLAMEVLIFLMKIVMINLIVINLNVDILASQQKFTCSKSAIEILKKGVKYIQS